MEYLPQRRWNSLGKKRAHIMIKAINKQLKERRMRRSFKKFIDASVIRTASAAAKPYKGDSSEFYLITGSIYTEFPDGVIMEYLVKISKKERILELKRRNMKKTDSDIQYAVSIKEDTVYPCLHFTRNHEELNSYTALSRESKIP
ncbi:hypothetical protein Tco_0755795 [Tanacetum coccineum]